MHSELQKISDKLLGEVTNINTNGFLAWVSGTAVDYFKGVELNDYDLVVYGVTKNELAEILNESFGCVNTETDSLVLNSRAPSGKRIDAILPGIFKFSKSQKNWKFSQKYSTYALQNKSLNPSQLLRDIQETGATRFSNRGLYFLYPSMKKITRNNWFDDIKNKKCRLLRKESRYIFYDYMRLFRFSSMGYELGEKTRKLMVENSLLDFLVWNDRKVEPDRISEYQDSLLKYILKVFRQKERGLECKPHRFFNLCIDTSLFHLLFESHGTAKKENIKSPEDFLLKAFDYNRSELNEVLGGQFIFKKNYGFD